MNWCSVTVLSAAWLVIAAGCDDRDYSSAQRTADGGAHGDSTVPDVVTGGERGRTLGLWHMDEAGTRVATLADSSGLGNDLVRADTSDSTTGHPGRFGLAVGEWAHETNAGSLDGYFTNTGLTGTSNLTQFTFEFWLFIQATGVVNDPNPFAFGADDADYFRIDDSNRLEFRSRSLPDERVSTDVLPLGRWNHVAVTGDASSVRIWLNGALAAEGALEAPVAIELLRVGAGSTGNANFSSGLVDEVRLSDGMRYTEPFDPPGAPFCVADADCDSGACDAGGVCAHAP